MNWFLKIKHWQLFLLWMCISILATFFSKFTIIVAVIYLTSVIGWIYLVGKSIQRIKGYQPKEKRPGLWAILSGIGYLIAIVLLELGDPFSNSRLFLGAVISLVSFVFLVKLMIYAVDCVSFTDGRKERNNDLFMPFLFFIIGVWFIQPRINKLEK